MKGNFLFHLNYNDDFKKVQYRDALQNLTEVFILCKYSFQNQNVDINNLIHNPKSVKISGNLILNFSTDQIMNFKKDKIDFYILDKERLMNIFPHIRNKLNLNSNIMMADKISHKILFFQHELKYICFTLKKNQSFNININNQNNNIQLDKNINLGNNNVINNVNIDNNQIFNDININQPISQPMALHQNKANINNIDDKSKIIRCLILLYGNEKEIMRLYSQGAFALQKYYLVNKASIDKFKEVYYYNELCNILSLQAINTFPHVLQNLNNISSMNEIKNIYNKIIIDTNLLSQMYLQVQSKKGGPMEE